MGQRVELEVLAAGGPRRGRGLLEPPLGLLELRRPQRGDADADGGRRVVSLEVGDRGEVAVVARGADARQRQRLRRRALGVGQQPVTVAAGIERDAGRGRRQLRTQAGRQRRERAAQPRPLPAGEQLQPVRAQQLDRERFVAAGVGVAQGIRQHRALGVPVRGAPMGGAHGVAVGGARAQQLGEQPVIAEPAGPVLDGAHEPGGRREALERLGPSRLAGDGLGERAAEVVGDRRAQQEPPLLGREQLEHLGGQEVADHAIVPGEVGDERLRVLAALQAQRRQAQTRRPALGARVQRRRRRRVELQPVRGQQRLRLRVRERQLGRADLGQARAHAQDVQGEHRVRPRGEDHPQGPRHVQEEKPELVADRPRAEQMRVVEDERHRRRELGQRVDEIGREAVADRIERRREGRAGAAQAREHRPPEPERIVVGALQRHPGDRQRRLLGPVRQQRRLAGTRRPAHERDGRRGDPAHESRPLDERPHLSRHPDLPSDQRRTHFSFDRGRHEYDAGSTGGCQQWRTPPVAGGVHTTPRLRSYE